MKRAVFVALSLVYTSVSIAQQVHHFTKGLLVSGVGRYGREALYTDPLAYKMYVNDLKHPVEGDSFGVDQRGSIVKW